MQTVLKYDNAILYANTMAIMKNFVVSKKINYVCMASSQNRFVLSDLSITIDFSEYKKMLCFLYKGKKAFYGSFYENEWFLDFSASAHFTLFESDFVDMTLGNYG